MGSGKLDDIADDLLLFFPFFHRKLMKGGYKYLGEKSSSQQCSVLGMLIRYGALPTSEIGRRLCISKPNMTTLIDRLIKEGNVKRIPDKEDRRIIKIAATEKGKRFMKEHKKLTREVIKNNLSSLGEKDRETVSDSLQKIKTIFSKISEEE